MIRKLQRRFILITMVSVISIFILILAVLNISVSYSAMQHGYATLQDYAMRDTADGIKALDTPDNIQISNPQKNLCLCGCCGSAFMLDSLALS